MSEDTKNLVAFNKVFFDLKKAEAGDFSEIKSYADKMASSLENVKKGQEPELNLFQVVDTLGANKKWLSEFSKAFNTEWNGRKDTVKFHALSDEQRLAQVEKLKEFNAEAYKNYDVNVAAVTGTIATDIIPTIEGLVQDTSILSRIQMLELEPNMYKQLYDFDDASTVLAASLSEVAAGSDVDDVERLGDKLFANNKIQASTTITDLAKSTFDATETGIFMARLTRRVQAFLITQILYGGTAASNGTAKAGIRGIKNNYGVSGTGNATGAIGAISYASKSAADTALGTASTDVYDLAVKVKRQLLPVYLSEEEESKYSYIMNRTTWGKISTVLDSNGRYKAQTAIDPTTGKAIKTIDGAEVIISPFVAADEVFLVPLSQYVLVTKGGVLNLNDSGILGIREARTVYVSRVWADGSMRYGFKFKNTTAVTIGTTAPDNLDQNLYRTFKIV